MTFIAKIRTALIGVFVLLGVLFFDHTIGVRLLAPAVAQAAGNVSLKDVTLKASTISIEIPKMVFVGTKLTHTELTAIFDSRSKKPFAKRLASLTARSIVIPKLIVTNNSKDYKDIITYYDVEMLDVVNGVIGKATSARSTSVRLGIDRDKEHQISNGTTGLSSYEMVDTVFAALLITETSSDTTFPKQKLSGSSAVYDNQITFSADGKNGIPGWSIFTRQSKSDGISARLGNYPLSTLFGSPDSGGRALAHMPSDEMRTLFATFSGILASFDLGKTIVNDTVITVERKDAPDNPYVVRIGLMSTGYNNQQFNLILNDISFSNEGKENRKDSISIKRFKIEDLSLETTITGLLALSKADLENNPESFKSIRLSPSGGKLALEDLDVDIEILPYAQADGEPKRLVFSLKSLDTTLGGDERNGIAHYNTILADLHLPLTTLSNIIDVKALRDIGYTELRLSSVFEGQWDEAKQQVKVDTFSLSGQDLGRITGSILYGNVKEWDKGIDAAIIALAEASIHEMSLTLENTGLYERIVKQQSQSGASTEDEVKQQYAALATISIPAMIGDTPTARMLASAAARFAQSPGKITVMAKAKDPNGVPVRSVSFETNDIDATLKRFDITTPE